MVITTALLISAAISAAVGVAGSIGAQALQNKSVKETNQQNKEIHEADNALNVEQAGIDRQFNADEADKQRAWEEQMSNTAIQRKADDLEKAGFNRALALGAPASTPVAASASSAPARSASALPMQAMNYSPMAQMASNLSHMVSSAGSIIALQKLTKSNPLAMKELAKVSKGLSKTITSADKIDKISSVL